jgi:hypothetical protein
MIYDAMSNSLTLGHLKGMTKHSKNFIAKRRAVRWPVTY